MFKLRDEVYCKSYGNGTIVEDYDNYTWKVQFRYDWFLYTKTGEFYGEEKNLKHRIHLKKRDPNPLKTAIENKIRYIENKVKDRKYKESDGTEKNKTIANVLKFKKGLNV
jgi:hypothetical protein